MSYVSDLSPSQRANALGIIAAVRARGWSQKAAVIAIETALVESGMRMIASANVPESQKYPHEKLSWTSDGLGHDHASMGMFQQQTGYRWALAGTSTMGSPDGWGTPATLMNAEKSTALFLDRLARYPWQTIPNWVAAQDVQGSAYDGNPRQSNNWNNQYGGNYHGQDARAQAIVAALWDEDEMDQATFDKFVKNSKVLRNVAADVAEDISAQAVAVTINGGTKQFWRFTFVRHPKFTLAGRRLRAVIKKVEGK